MLRTIAILLPLAGCAPPCEQGTPYCNHTLTGWRSQPPWGADPNATFSPVRVAPMGPEQYMINCVDSPRYYAQQANRVCPAAYDVVSNVNSADFGRMTMIVRCRLDSTMAPVTPR
jgi:hypothetical protein